MVIRRFVRKNRTNCCLAKGIQKIKFAPDHDGFVIIIPIHSAIFFLRKSSHNTIPPVIPACPTFLLLPYSSMASISLRVQVPPSPFTTHTMAPSPRLRPRHLWRTAVQPLKLHNGRSPPGRPPDTQRVGIFFFVRRQRSNLRNGRRRPLLRCEQSWRCHKSLLCLILALDLAC